MKLPFTWSVLESEAACSEIPEEKLMAMHFLHGQHTFNTGVVAEAQRQIRKLAVIGLGCIPASMLFGYAGVRALDYRPVAVSIISALYSVKSAKEIRKAIGVHKEYTMQNEQINRNFNHIIAGSMADNLLLRQVIEEETEIAYRDVPIPARAVENQ